MRAGELIGEKYRLTRQIGEGAMGVVWAAVNEVTSREVAVKLVLRSSEELRTRLLREARICGSLSHRNIIEVLDLGQNDRGDPFLVMPLLTGETLAEMLERHRRMDPAEAAKVGRDVGRALMAAHGARIIHRDLKPANIFLQKEAGTEGAIVKVLDFGVSKDLSAKDAIATILGGTVGSPAYMSPEQIRADRGVDQRTDIWSMGVMLFEMLTGVRPFQGEAQTIIQNVLAGPIPSVSTLVRFVDPGLDGIVARCLERDRDRRIGSAEELVAALQRFVREPSRSSADLAAHVPAPPPPPSPSPSPEVGWMDPLVARGGTEEVELPTIPMGRAPSPLHAPPPLHAPSGLAQLDTTERLPGAYGVAPGVPQGSGLAGLTRTLEIIVEPGGPQGAPPQVGGAAQMNAMSEVRPHPASPGHRGGLLGGRVSWKAVIAIGAAIGTLFIVVGIMVLLRALSGRAPAGPEASVSASSAPSGGGASAPPASAGPASSVASSPPGPAPATLTSVSGSAGEATRTATAAPPPPPPPPPLPVPVPAPPPKQVPSTPPGTGGVKAPPAVKPVEAKPAAPKGRIF